MHTSVFTYWLFIAGITFAVIAQILNYALSTFATKPSRRLGTLAVLFALTGIGLAGLAGFRASINWGRLPMSPRGLSAGQLWDDGGIPAIVGQLKQQNGAKIRNTVPMIAVIYLESINKISGYK